VNEEVLDRDKLRVIRLQADLVREGQFFLAGGTGLGLRLGHRLSDDPVHLHEIHSLFQAGIS
jgi:hypothetical protein